MSTGRWTLLVINMILQCNSYSSSREGSRQRAHTFWFTNVTVSSIRTSSTNLQKIQIQFCRINSQEHMRSCLLGSSTSADFLKQSQLRYRSLPQSMSQYWKRIEDFGSPSLYSIRPSSSSHSRFSAIVNSTLIKTTRRQKQAIYKLYRILVERATSLKFLSTS